MFALSALTLLTLAAEPPKLAVMSFGCSPEIAPDVCEAYERRFLDRLTKSKDVGVTSSRDVAAAIGLERQKALLGCSDDGGAECLAELSGALGVDGILTGTITRTRSGYLLSIKVVKAKTGSQWVSASERAQSDAEVQDSLDFLANRFADELNGRKPTRLFRPVMLGVTGLGVGMVVVGGVLISMAKSQEAILRSDVPQTPMEIRQSVSSGSTFQTSGFLLATLGVPIAITAGLLALIDPGGDRMALVPVDRPAWRLRRADVEVAVKHAAVLCLLVATGCTNFELLGQLKPRKVVLRTNDAIALADGGTLLQPRPKAGLKPCIAWVDVALTSQWQKVEGEWTADGECTIHNVPPGELLVNRGQPDSVVYISTNLDEIDLGVDYTGRPFSHAGPKTTLTVDLSGAAPLETYNMISMYLPEFGTGLVNLSGGGASGVGVPTGMLGATSFPASFDFDGLPLVKSSESIDIFQGTPLAPGSLSFRLRRRATVKVNLVDAQNVRTSAVMTELPTNGATAFSAFSFQPQTFYAAVEADIVEPSHVGIGVYQEAVLDNSASPLSVQTTYLFGDKTGAVSATAVSADPFPGRPWTRRIEIQGVWDSVVSTTNSTTGITREGTIGLSSIFRGPADNLGWLNAGWMTPPRSIVVRKRDGTTVETGAIDSASPTLVWNEPVSGLPNTYVVGFYEMTTDPTDATKLVFARLPQLIRTRNTEAHVPPGILKLDTNYVFTVLATDCFTTMPERPTRPTQQAICGLADNRSRVMFTPEQ